jgi:hypothetical protein
LQWSWIIYRYLQAAAFILFGLLFCPVLSGIAFLFRLPVPWQCIGSVCVPNSAWDYFSICTLCRSFWGLAVTPVTDASVAVVKVDAHILCLNTVMVHRPVSPRITQLVFLCRNYCVSSVYIFKTTVPLKSTIISNPYVHSGCNIWFMNQWVCLFHSWLYSSHIFTVHFYCHWNAEIWTRKNLHHHHHNVL